MADEGPRAWPRAAYASLLAVLLAMSAAAGPAAAEGEPEDGGPDVEACIDLFRYLVRLPSDEEQPVDDPPQDEGEGSGGDEEPSLPKEDEEEQETPPKEEEPEHNCLAGAVANGSLDTSGTPVAWMLDSGGFEIALTEEDAPLGSSLSALPGTPSPLGGMVPEALQEYYWNLHLSVQWHEGLFQYRFDLEVGEVGGSGPCALLLVVSYSPSPTLYPVLGMIVLDPDNCYTPLVTNLVDRTMELIQSGSP